MSSEEESGRYTPAENVFTKCLAYQLTRISGAKGALRREID